MHESSQPSSIRSDSSVVNTASVSTASLKIRVINPELARICNIDVIRPMRDAILLSCTLKELKSRVQKHLGFPAGDDTCPELECNCKLARQIDENAVLNERGTGQYEALRTVILVHGNHGILALPVTELTRTTLQETAAKYLVMPDKVLNVIGGVGETTYTTTNTRYLKAPVLAICSGTQHAQRHQHGGAPSHNRDLIVDIHTLECPIELTAHNADMTLADAGLGDCAIDDVLNIFAVQRWANTNGERPR